ncbi:MAG: hypothetical protein RJA92_193 [Bacteroidota bacterium]|jgi:hypothetical protein
MTPNFAAFRALIMHPVKFWLYMLAKLPMGFLAGLKLTQLDPCKAVVQVKYKWLTQNPFGSMYFAVLSMAAEFSSGILCLANIYKSDPAISMLVVKMESHFYKKAVGVITFTCTDGDAIIAMVQTAKQTGEGVTLVSKSTGKNQSGEVVAEFFITWSLKAKASKSFTAK